MHASIGRIRIQFLNGQFHIEPSGSLHETGDHNLRIRGRIQDSLLLQFPSIMAPAWIVTAAQFSQNTLYLYQTGCLCRIKSQSADIRRKQKLQPDISFLVGFRLTQ